MRSFYVDVPKFQLKNTVSVNLLHGESSLVIHRKLQYIAKALNQSFENRQLIKQLVTCDSAVGSIQHVPLLSLHFPLLFTSFTSMCICWAGLQQNYRLPFRNNWWLFLQTRNWLPKPHWRTFPLTNSIFTFLPKVYPFSPFRMLSTRRVVCFDSIDIC